MTLLDQVNIKQGSDSCMRFSNGNTLPYVQMPYGFAAFVPQTDSSRRGWFYHPKDRSFEGIRITRQPSPWIGEQGAICILPQYDVPYESPDARWSGFRPENATLAPNYMRYELLRSRSVIELVPTERGACVRVEFLDSSRDNFLSLLPVTAPCEFEVRDNLIFASTDLVTDRKGIKNAKIYYALQFEEGDFSDTSVKDGAIHIKAARSIIEFRLSISLISTEQALINMRREHTYKDIYDLKEQTGRIWEEYLSRISFAPCDSELTRTFYSCMYRFLLFPHKAYELDESGEPLHYSFGKDSVVKGYHYTDNGFWDTYRTVYSLLPLVAPDEYSRILKSFICDYKNDGWLPRWTATDAKCCMPSTMIDPVLADGAKRGIYTSEELEIILEAMLKHANIPSEYDVFGRTGCEDYVRLGYVPSNYHESVNLTLDAAYGDWCIAQIATILGKNDIAEEYYRRAKSYRNLFDAKSGFMRAKDSEGVFRSNFSPERWGLDYTEASAYQTSFAVQHDLDGLCELHGGRDALIKKLDEFFDTKPLYLIGGYGREIHEMSEMAAADFGQCAISNQPSFHIPFIYAYLGMPEKTEFWIEKLCREAFSYRDDGFPGDEDNGTTAAWFMMATMGFYPLTPGKNEFIRFKPLLDNVRINGKTVDELLER